MSSSICNMLLYGWLNENILSQSPILRNTRILSVTSLDYLGIIKKELNWWSRLFHKYLPWKPKIVLTLWDPNFEVPYALDSRKTCGEHKAGRDERTGGLIINHALHILYICLKPLLYSFEINLFKMTFRFLNCSFICIVFILLTFSKLHSSCFILFHFKSLEKSFIKFVFETFPRNFLFI